MTSLRCSKDSASHHRWPSSRSIKMDNINDAKGAVQVQRRLEIASFPRRLAILFCMPLALISIIAILLKEFLKSPYKFFTRSQHREVQLPPSLESAVHEDLDVGSGVRLHTVSFGRQPDKPLMLFLHGFPECWYSWRDLLVHFHTEYDVVAVDMRGFNLSTKPKVISAYTMNHLTADVAAVVRALGRSSCTLVGHDWGAFVSWAVAGRYPGLVDRLVVMAGPHWWLYQRNLTTEQMARSYYFLCFLLPLLPELLLLHTDSALLDDILGGRSPEYSVRRHGVVSEADVEVYKAAMQQPGAATASLNYYRNLMYTYLGLLPMHPEVEAGVLRQLEMPVLAVWGEKDHALCLSNIRDIGLIAPRAEVHILPNCSHWIQSDQPQELRRVIEDWLAENPLPMRKDS
ncbi:hypothetical protein Vafri_5730 [Volvox africanus]|nr:hypothetical protein Vafri_5730 [Volvox africanus]